MILLQLSAGQGPVECCQAVGLALQKIQQQCQQQKIKLNIIEKQLFKSGHPQSGFKSVLIQLDDSNKKDQTKQLAMSWKGVMLWIKPSNNKGKNGFINRRKNWYFSGHIFELNDCDLNDYKSNNNDPFNQEITYKTCRASGPGGQHVNSTDSAVRATHSQTGLTVRIESERSQHANKRLARIVLFQKLAMAKQEGLNQQQKDRRQQHWELERGNPVRVFKGSDFKVINL
ncbi:MAG: peptide chain release factor H [Saccharospirillaceae bacterium]|nr:peptide chain release factor H [Pseudomonadales bacterium]NRB80600.1 peptide chain release factor H [Saccharospirillaceae bacterium]